MVYPFLSVVAGKFRVCEGAQFGCGDRRLLGHLRSIDGTALYAPRDETRERARRRGFVHDGRLCPVHIVPQSLGRSVEALTVERISREVAGWQLRRMHVPTLVIAALEGTAHQPRVQAPGVSTPVVRLMLRIDSH